MQRRHKQTLRVFEAAHGSPPWDCFFCHTVVERLGRSTWDGNMHHVDGDETNDTPENVVPTHTICHQQYHAPTDEARQKISLRLRGRPSPTRGMKFSAETNAKKGRSGPANHQFGKTPPLKTRLAVSGANRRQVTCDKCDESVNEKWLRRHQDGGCQPTRMITINGVQRVRGKEPKLTCEGCGKPYAARWMTRHRCTGER